VPLSRPLVRKARPDDNRAIARLHREIISWGLLQQFGEAVVAGFYAGVTRSPAAFCFVAEEEQTIVGFAAGVCDWPQLRRAVIRQTWWPLLKALPSLIGRGRWRRLLETRRYTASGVEGVQAEFISFGVREDARGRLWTGAALANAVMEEFRRRSIPRIRGVVWERNQRAIRFFEAMGFRFVSEVEIHPGETSRTFVRDLTTTP